MDAFVQSLLERLPEEKRGHMIALMHDAFEELEQNGIMNQLSPEVKKQVHHADPRVSMKAKTQLAKTVGSQCIPTSQPMPLKGGAVAHMIVVHLDQRFCNAIALCIQGGLEGLYLAGMPKKCENNIMDYYINLRNTEEEAQPLLKKLATVQSFYENFRIHVTIPKEGGLQELALPAPEAAASHPAQKKAGFFSRLFGKKK